MIIFPAVAGTFYPADKDELRASLRNLFEGAKGKSKLPIPKAIIAPHAGYIYSGPIAASAYACLPKAHLIKRVVIAAPAHQYPLYGIATTKATSYMTPLGEIKIDQEALDPIVTMPDVSTCGEAFVSEHALEVQLPFLQYTLKKFSLVPLLVGLVQPDSVAAVLEKLWNGPETLVIVSSDLSHYRDYLLAREIDWKAKRTILELRPDDLESEQACGSIAIKGLLKVAKTHNLKPTLVDLRNSGDTAGTKDSVVGYGAFHFG